MWKGYFAKVHATLNDSSEYHEFPVGNKLLSFLFTMVEVLKQDRSYAKIAWSTVLTPRLYPSFMYEFKKDFDSYASELIRTGLDTGEVASRMLLDKYYGEVVWLKTIVVLRFWLSDESTGFEKTDAMIEKSVSLVMDTLGRTALDSLFDLGKFLIVDNR